MKLFCAFLLVVACLMFAALFGLMAAMPQTLPPMRFMALVAVAAVLVFGFFGVRETLAE